MHYTGFSGEVIERLERLESKLDHFLELGTPAFMVRALEHLEEHASSCVKFDTIVTGEGSPGEGWVAFECSCGHESSKFYIMREAMDEAPSYYKDMFYKKIEELNTKYGGLQEKKEEVTERFKEPLSGLEI